MAFRSALQKAATSPKSFDFGLRRWTHAMASPLNTLLDCPIGKPPQLVLPEDDSEIEQRRIEIQLPVFDNVGSLELMAVPKKKTSKSRKGIRNGPKALKPVPVIIRCTVCGRIKLPHFYCCSGIREDPSRSS